MTGNLSIQGYLYPSMYLLPYYNNTTNRTVFEGSYAGASSFASWEDNTGNNRRMLEVRTKAYQSSLDYAVLLRVCDAGNWGELSYIPFRHGDGRACSQRRHGRDHGCRSSCQSWHLLREFAAFIGYGWTDLPGAGLKG